LPRGPNRAATEATREGAVAVGPRARRWIPTRTQIRRGGRSGRRAVQRRAGGRNAEGRKQKAEGRKQKALAGLTFGELVTLIDALNYGIEMKKAEMESNLPPRGVPRDQWDMDHINNEADWKAEIKLFRALRRKLLAWERVR
jgi:hypothetical protein